MKRIVFLLLAVFSLNGLIKINAQVLDGIYDKEHVPSRRPVPYYFIREADIMWSKRVWRIIDLREKMNHPLYYPTVKIGDRMSLIDLFIYGIKNEGLVAYKSNDDRFSAPMTTQDLELAFGAKTDTTYIEDPETGMQKPVIIEGQINSYEVKQYKLKEEWYFDRQRSYLDVRIIGICPIRFYTKGTGTGTETEIRKAEVFWIYYPEARRILANHEVFNPSNDAERKTFDDIFFKRRFSSFAIQESNVYDDRTVSLYRQGIHAMQEAERIKDMLFKTEIDLWEY